MQAKNDQGSGRDDSGSGNCHKQKLRLESHGYSNLRLSKNGAHDQNSRTRL